MKSGIGLLNGLGKEGSRDLPRIKIFVDNGSTQQLIDSHSTGDSICAKIHRKKASQNNDYERGRLYISTMNPKKKPLVKQILRLVRSDEKILELQDLFKKKKIGHEFYYLMQAECRPLKPLDYNEFNDKFFKRNKWERMGELLKKSERAEEGSKEQYSKKMFYLGSDILYYIDKSKDSIFSDHSRILCS
eukprot:TRINITY_DN8591_c0_g1_i2.p1 TRINITY_DN8591_c0_g1~~TRINITY_DN8591_c0_g1_i2.p1  ORF type:complete len:189 (-),score=40.86 TRINITY_DN8591_c0_g1_i2:377-943(-)